MEQQHHHTKHRWLTRRKRRIILTSIGLVFLIATGVFLFFALRTDFNIRSFNDHREIAYKSDYSLDYGTVCYGNLFYCDNLTASTTDQVDTSKLGEYKLLLHFDHDGQEKLLEQIVVVKDLVPPVIEVADSEIALCKDNKVPDFKYSAIDDYDGDITDKATINYESPNVSILSTDNAGNRSIKQIPATAKDKTPPVITINGSEKYTSRLGLGYSDAGATAIDNCDGEVTVQVSGTVNTNVAGDYTITYTATDSFGNQSTATRTVTIATSIPQPTGNVIYLTFDDGPSEHTDRLLDVLKKHDVKATFFVTGKGSDDSILRAYKEGHSIGLHTLSHNYSKIYRSESAFYDDLYAVQNRVKNITGYTSTLMRFPGGSSNTVSRSYDGGTRIMSKLVRSVAQKGFTYFDWNVSSGDAGGATTPDQVYNNVINTLKRGNSIVLQHDTQGFSVDAVERIIEYGKANGYTFARLEPGYWGAHHGVNN